LFVVLRRKKNVERDFQSNVSGGGPEHDYGIGSKAESTRWPKKVTVTAQHPLATMQAL
jgi:hypothetical protein